MAKKTKSKTATSAKTVKAIKSARKVTSKVAAPKAQVKPLRDRLMAVMVKMDVLKKLNNVNWKFLSRVALVVIIGLALFLLAKKYRGLVLAGFVNSTPITRFELNQTMATRYGKTTFDELVNNELLKQEAAKMKITVSAEEIATQIKSLTEKVGGEAAMKDALIQYGLSQAELEDQIRMSEMQRKIAEKQGSFDVTDEEVSTYFKQNEASFETKKLDEVKDQIVTTLKDQKMQEAFNTWFTDVRAKAKVQSYL